MSGSRKFALKVAIFITPFVLYVFNDVRELFSPFNTYAFRAWEALVVREPNGILTGPFYPNADLDIVEYGDITSSEGYAVGKKVRWYTDKYGYRKKETGREKYEIVIIGDSFTAGSGLDQSDMLSEKLEKILGVSVYPYAPAIFSDFIEEKRFIENPPNVVVIASTEKLVRNLPNIGVGAKELGFVSKIMSKMRFVPGIDRIAIANDRYLKHSFLHYAYARVYEVPKMMVQRYLAKRKPLVVELENESEMLPETIGENVSTDGRMVFTVQSDDKFVEWKDQEFEVAVDRIESYKNYIEQRGMKFVFLPIPNKENIYYAICKGGVKMHSLERMIAELRRRGVVVANLQSAFDESVRRNPGELLYHPDDTHWTPYGVEVAASLLAEVIDR